MGAYQDDRFGTDWHVASPTSPAILIGCAYDK